MLSWGRKMSPIFPWPHSILQGKLGNKLSQGKLLSGQWVGTSEPHHRLGSAHKHIPNLCDFSNPNFF